MTNLFTLIDIPALKERIATSSISNDRAAAFLNSFTFESVYNTEDGSVVFVAGGQNEIEIEFFNLSNPVTRSCSVMYMENGVPFILYM